MDELSYEFRDFQVGDQRHLRMKVNLLVRPYVRQTKTTRYRDDAAGQRAREYNDQQARIRDAMRLIFLKEGLESFEAKRLGFASWFWLCPKKVYRVQRFATVDDPAQLDLSNLEKAIEDALRGVAYPDDVRLWGRGKGFKNLADDDWFAVYVWELSEDELLEVDEWVA